MAEKTLVNETGHENRTLLKVPRDLVLSSESVEEYAKENKEFRQLFDAAGHQVSAFIFLSWHHLYDFNEAWMKCPNPP